MATAVVATSVLPSYRIVFFLLRLQLCRIEATLCPACCARGVANNSAQVERGEADTKELKERLRDYLEAFGTAPSLDTSAVGEALHKCAASVRC